MELIIFAALAGLGYYFMTNGPGSAADDARNGWRPVLNPTPLSTASNDELAKIAAANGGATIQFGLVHDPFEGESASSYALAKGQLLDVRVADAGDGTSKRLWKVRFQSAVAANPPPEGSGTIASLSADDIKGAITKAADTNAQKNLPKVGAEFILEDDNLYLGSGTTALDSGYGT